MLVLFGLETGVASKFQIERDERRKWHPMLRTESQVFGAQASVFSDLGKGRRSDLFVVMEAKGEVGPARALQLSMRADLFLECPSETQ